MITDFKDPLWLEAIKKQCYCRVVFCGDKKKLKRNGIFALNSDFFCQCYCSLISNLITTQIQLSENGIICQCYCSLISNLITTQIQLSESGIICQCYCSFSSDIVRAQFQFGESRV